MWGMWITKLLCLQHRIFVFNKFVELYTACIQVFQQLYTTYDMYPTNKYNLRHVSNICKQPCYCFQQICSTYDMYPTNLFNLRHVSNKFVQPTTCIQQTCSTYDMYPTNLFNLRHVSNKFVQYHSMHATNSYGETLIQSSVDLGLHGSLAHPALISRPGNKPRPLQAAS